MKIIILLAIGFGTIAAATITILFTNINQALVAAISFIS